MRSVGALRLWGLLSIFVLACSAPRSTGPFDDDASTVDEGVVADADSTDAPARPDASSDVTADAPVTVDAPISVDAPVTADVPVTADAPIATDGPRPVDAAADGVAVDRPVDAACSDTCTAPTCAGDLLAACVRGADGCLHGVPAACPASQVCRGGACVARCTDACPDGAVRCRDSVTRELCVAMTGGCRAWQATACEAGTTCASGVCAATCAVTCPAGYTCGPMGVCRSGDPARINLDVVTTTVNGAITLNGAAPMLTGRTCTSTTTIDGRGAVRFVEATRGYTFVFGTRGCTGPAAFTGSVYPGTYRVTAYSAGYSDIPTTEQVVRDALVVGPGGIADLPLNVVTTTVNGAITLNGAAPLLTGRTCTSTTTIDGRGAVRFVETTHGYTFVFGTRGCTGPAAFTGSVYPGTYRVTAYSAGYSDIPTIEQVVRDALVVGPGGIASLPLDVVTTTVNGAITLNGAAPLLTGRTCTSTTTIDGRGAVRFVEATHGYTFVFGTRGCTGPAAFTGSVYPGTYRVTAYSAGYSDIPTTEQVVREALVVGPGGIADLPLDVVTTTVNGAITLNGAAPLLTGRTCTSTTTIDGRGAVRFVETTHGYTFVFGTRGCTGPAAFTGSVYPGTYRVTAYSAGYSDIPTIEQVVRDALVIGPTGLASLPLDVVTTTVDGAITLNGAAPMLTGRTCTSTTTIDGRGAVRLVETTRGYTFVFGTRGCTGPAAFTGSVYPGTYRVTAYSAGYSDIPTIEQVVRDALVIGPTGLASLPLDVVTRTVSGTITLNGAGPLLTGRTCTSTTTIDGRGAVRFVETTRGYTFVFGTRGCTGPAAFTGSVYPGTYRVTAYSAGYSDIPTIEQVVVDRLEIP